MTEADYQATLEGLVAQDPDKLQDPEDRRFLVDDDGQREVLGCLMRDLALVRKWSQFILPMHFVNEAHQVAYRCLTEFVAQHDTLPSKPQMRHAINKALGDRDSLYYEGEFSTVWEYFRDTATTGSIDRMLYRFVDDGMMITGMYKVNDARMKGVAPEEMDWLVEELLLKNRRGLRQGSSDNRLCTLDELFLETEQEYKWLVPNRIPAGKLMLVAGPGKKGKTTSLIHSFVDVVFNGKTLGEDAQPFNILYLDYENDTAYLKNIILGPVMQGRDWQELGKWLHISNRQVKTDHLKLQPHVTAEYLKELTGRYEGPVLVLVDSLRRAFGRTPGLKDNWEWSASVISGLLDPLSELAHKTGHTIAVIHHYNNDGRASGSTDLIAAPDVIWDFEVVRNGSGQETNDRRIKISGRLPYIEPLLLTFENNVYRYLGAGKEAVAAKKEETTFTLMEKVVTALEAGPKSGAALTDKLAVTNKNDVYKCLNILSDRGVVKKGTKEHHLAADYMDAWRKLLISCGYRDGTPGGDCGMAAPSSPSPSLVGDGDDHRLSA